MNEKERQVFVYKEIDKSIEQLVLSKKFLQKAIEVSKGADTNYESLFHIMSRIK